MCPKNESVLIHVVCFLTRRDLTADLSTLNVGPVGSEDENVSADDLDASSVDDLDTVPNPESVTFDLPASPSKLNHLNKNRAPKQKKRPPARYSMFVAQDEELTEAPAPAPEAAPQEVAPPAAQIKKKRGSKEKKKKKGKYNKKADAKLDDSVVEV